MEHIAAHDETALGNPSTFKRSTRATAGTRSSPIGVEDVDTARRQRNQAVLSKGRNLEKSLMSENRRLRTKKSRAPGPLSAGAWSTMTPDSITQPRTVVRDPDPYRPGPSQQPFLRSAPLPRPRGEDLEQSRLPLRVQSQQRGAAVPSKYANTGKPFFNRSSPRPSSDLPPDSPDRVSVEYREPHYAPEGRTPEQIIAVSSDEDDHQTGLKAPKTRTTPLHQPEPRYPEISPVTNIRSQPHVDSWTKEPVQNGGHAERGNQQGYKIPNVSRPGPSRPGVSYATRPQTDAKRLIRGSGMFGSHGKSSDSKNIVGRQRQQGSESPTKLLGSKGGEGRSMRYNRDSHLLRDAIEDIDSPDGPFPTNKEDGHYDSDYIEAVRPSGLENSKERRRSDGRANTESKSPEKVPAQSAGPRKPMKMRDGSLPESSRLSKVPANFAIKSSNISKLSLASLQYACIELYEMKVNAASVSVSNNTITFNKRQGSYIIDRGIDLSLVTQATGKYPTLRLSIAIHGRNEQVDRFREILEKQPDAMPPEFSIFVVFEDGSQEARQLVQHLYHALRLNNTAIEEIDDSAAQALRKSIPAVVPRGPNTRTRNSEANVEAAKGAEHRVSVPPRRTRGRDSDASLAGSSKAKAKAKSGEQDPKQTTLSFAASDPDFAELSTGRPTHKPTTYASVRKSSRIKANGDVNFIEGNSDDEILAPPAKIMPSLSAAEKQAILFEYPLTGRSEVQITGGDRYRVRTDDFLNDTLLEFGLKHVIYSLPPSSSEKVHLFSSFFYEKLSSKKGKWQREDDTWPAYDSVKKWTKNHGIFDKDYLIVPINENFHWYLAVIYNPRGILQARPATPEPDPARHATRSRMSLENQQPNSEEGTSRHPSLMREGSSEISEAVEGESGLNVGAAKSSASVSHGPSDHDPMSDNYGEGDQNLLRSRSSSAKAREGENLGDGDQSTDGTLLESHDQSILNQSDANDGDINMDRDVQHSMRKMSINGYATGRSDLEEPPSSGWIRTPTMGAYDRQNSPEKLTLRQPEKPEELEALAKTEVETIKPTAKPDYSIWRSEECFILTFDSLGGAHRSVASHLQRWLQFEARDKKKLSHDRPSNAQYVEARCPQQPNFSDCGLWLIHYVKNLLLHPEEIIKFVQRAPPRLAAPDRKPWEVERDKVWRATETSRLRAEFGDEIDQLTAKYRSMRTTGDSPSGGDLAMVDQSQEDSFELVDPLHEHGGHMTNMHDPTDPATWRSPSIETNPIADACQQPVFRDETMNAETPEAVETVERENAVGVATMEEEQEEQEPVEEGVRVPQQDANGQMKAGHGEDDSIRADIDPCLDVIDVPGEQPVIASASDSDPSIQDTDDMDSAHGSSQGRGTSIGQPYLQPAITRDTVTSRSAMVSLDDVDELVSDLGSADRSEGEDDNTSMEISDNRSEDQAPAKPAGRRAAPSQLTWSQSVEKEPPAPPKSPFDNFGDSMPGQGPTSRRPRTIAMSPTSERSPGSLMRFAGSGIIDQRPLQPITLAPIPTGLYHPPEQNGQGENESESLGPPDIDELESITSASAENAVPENVQKRKASMLAITDMMNPIVVADDAPTAKIPRHSSAPERRSKTSGAIELKEFSDEDAATPNNRRKLPLSKSKGGSSSKKSRANVGTSAPIAAIFVNRMKLGAGSTLKKFDSKQAAKGTDGTTAARPIELDESSDDDVTTVAGKRSEEVWV